LRHVSLFAVETGASFGSGDYGNLRTMLAAAIALIALGVVLGLFFPVMFVAALAGVVLPVLFLVSGARRAKAEADSADPGTNTLK
jgi:hypothetical protein